MKKIILLVSTLAFIAASCSQSARLVNLRAATDIGFREAKKLADEYEILVLKDPDLAIRSINVSAFALKDLARQCQELKLIMGATAAGNIQVLVECRQNFSEKKWYYLTDLFKASQPGSGNKPPLCNGTAPFCKPPFPTQGVGSQITSAAAERMSDSYYDLARTTPDRIVLQMNLMPAIMDSVLGDNENVKLITALQPSDTTTMVLELTKSNVVKYVDARTIIKDPVCPPPGGCTITQL